MAMIPMVERNRYLVNHRSSLDLSELGKKNISQLLLSLTSLQLGSIGSDLTCRKKFMQGVPSVVLDFLTFRMTWPWTCPHRHLHSTPEVLRHIPPPIAGVTRVKVRNSPLLPVPTGLQNFRISYSVADLALKLLLHRLLVIAL